MPMLLGIFCTKTALDRIGRSFSIFYLRISLFWFCSLLLLYVCTDFGKRSFNYISIVCQLMWSSVFLGKKKKLYLDLFACFVFLFSWSIFLCAFYFASILRETFLAIFKAPHKNGHPERWKCFVFRSKWVI